MSENPPDPGSQNQNGGGQEGSQPASVMLASEPLKVETSLPSGMVLPVSPAPPAQLSEARRQQLIEEMARIVVARRLETVAVFMLEAHRPVSFVASQGLLLTAPLLGAFFGFERVDELGRLLEDRANLDRLIERIEQLAQER